MTPILIAISVVVVIALAFLLIRREATPPAGMFMEIRAAILDRQRVASQNILPLEQAQKVTGIDRDQMLRQSCHVRETIRYVYTIEESENGLVHTISSQLLKPKPEKYHVQCMLVAMLTLNQCLDESGVDPKSIEFNIDRSATGTHYVAMLLSRDKHDQIMANCRVADRTGEAERRLTCASPGCLGQSRMRRPQFVCGVNASRARPGKCSISTESSSPRTFRPPLRSTRRPRVPGEGDQGSAGVAGGN